MNAQHRRLAALAALAVLSLPLAALADGPGSGTDAPRTLVLVGDGGETLSIGLEGSELTIVTRDGDASTVRIVDLEQVGLLVRGGLQEACAALRDLHLDVRLGPDDGVDSPHGDRSPVPDQDRDLQELRAQLDELKSEMHRLRQELAAREP